MALGFTCRSSSFSTANATSYAATAYTPAAGSMLVACVVVSGSQVNPPSVSGHGVPWNFVTAQNLSSTHRLVVYVTDAGVAPTSSAFTVSGFGATQTGCAIIEYEVTGADVSAGALSAVVQAVSATGSGTSGSIALAAATAAENRPLAMFVHLANEATTPRTNWVESTTPASDGNYNQPATGAEVQTRTTAFETTASATWTSNVAWAGIAMEIRASTLAAQTANVAWTTVAALTTAIVLSGSSAAAITSTAALTFSTQGPVVVSSRLSGGGRSIRRPKHWGPPTTVIGGTAAALAGTTTVAVTSTGALSTAISLSNAPAGTDKIAFFATGATPGATGLLPRTVVSPLWTTGRPWRTPRRWGPPPESNTVDVAAFIGQTVVSVTTTGNLTAVSGRVVVSARQSAGATVIWGPPPASSFSPSQAFLVGTTTVTITSTGALTTAIRVTGATAVALTTTGDLTTSVPLAGTAPVVVTTTGALTALPGSLGGTAAVVVTTTGTVTTGIAVASATSVVVTTTGALTTGIALTGAGAVAVTTTATLTTNIGIFATTAPIVWTSSGILTTQIALASDVAVVFTSTGSADFNTPPVIEAPPGPHRATAPLRQRAVEAPLRPRTVTV